MPTKSEIPHSPIFDRIGCTPLVAVLSPSGRTIHCKLEYLNPSGSIKDRIAYNILRSHYHAIKTQHGGKVVEASSGNTSISLAMVCQLMNLKFHAFLPDTASVERGLTIRAYGGEMHYLSKDKDGLTPLTKAAKDFAHQENAFFVDQFKNKLNYRAHEKTTGPEIIKDLGGKRVDAFVCGIGTGGTLVGVRRCLMDDDQNPVYRVPRLKTSKHLHDIGFTSKEVNRLFTDGESVSEIQGLDDNAIDNVYVSEDDALNMTTYLWGKGLPVGPAAGTNFQAAEQVAQNLEQEATIVTILTDRMERYFSTPAFQKIKEDLEYAEIKRQEKIAMNNIASILLADQSFIKRIKEQLS